MYRAGACPAPSRMHNAKLYLSKKIRNHALS